MVGRGSGGVAAALVVGAAPVVGAVKDLGFFHQAPYICPPAGVRGFFVCITMQELSAIISRAEELQHAAANTTSPAERLILLARAAEAQEQANRALKKLTDKEK